MLKINEIFFSIQGESSWVGQPTVFIRTSGCPLRCSYCDTKYAYHEGKSLSIDSILAEVEKHPTKYVCVTGGEPLAQKSTYDLLEKLCDLKYCVSLETSGFHSCENVDPRVKKIIDVKTPDSGAPNSFNLDNLAFANSQTEFKFVICSQEDLDWAEEFSGTNQLFNKSNVLYSPSFDVVTPLWLAKEMLKKGSRARLQLQLHKIIWSPEARGV